LRTIEFEAWIKKKAFDEDVIEIWSDTSVIGVDVVGVGGNIAEELDATDEGSSICSLSL